MLREPAAAEETLQEAFVSVWRHAGSYVPSLSQPQTWLASVVRNRCLDRLRRREPDTVPLARDDDADSELDLPAQGGLPDELLRAAADARSVRACVEASGAIGAREVQGVTPASARQSLSRASPRRTHDFTVPSGSPRCRATSACVMPR